MLRALLHPEKYNAEANGLGEPATRVELAVAAVSQLEVSVNTAMPRQPARSATAAQYFTTPQVSEKNMKRFSISPRKVILAHFIL